MFKNLQRVARNVNRGNSSCLTGGRLASALSARGAAGDALSDAAPIAATAMEPDKQANASLCFDMELPPSPPEKSQ